MQQLKALEAFDKLDLSQQSVSDLTLWLQTNMGFTLDRSMVVALIMHKIINRVTSG